MSYNLVNPTTGALTKAAGGTLYADTPIGTIISSGAAWDNPPAGYLFCGGQAISRVAYAALFAVIGTTFGAGDGSTTFNVPELRGEFLRGAGTNQHAGQGNGGAPGFHQDATTIPYTYSNGDANNVNFAGEGTTQNLDSTPTVTGKYQTVNSANHGTSSAYNFGTVRPTNTSVNFFIKATNVAVPADFINAVDDAFNTLNASKVPVAFEALPNNDCNDAHVAGFHLYKWGDVQATHSPNDVSNGTMYTFVYPTSGAFIKAWQQCYTSGTKVFLRSGVSSDNGATYTWNDWEQLVTKSDAVIRHDYSIAGTVDAVADTQTLVNHIITLGVGTYAGEFKRSGITFGSYRLTYLIDGTYSKSVSGLVTYSINASADATYQVSYVEDIEHSLPPEWKIEKLVANAVQSGSTTIPAQTLHNLESAEVTIPLTVNDFYCGRVDFANLPSVNMNLSYNDFSGAFQDARETVSRSQFVLYPIGKAYSGTLHLYLTNYTGSDVVIGNVQVVYYLEHHAS